MITIKNKGYYKAVASVDVAYTLDPTDLNGNLLERVFIDVDATAGSVTVTLPEIATLPQNWNCEIIFVLVAGANNLIVEKGGVDDTIGSATSVTTSGVGTNITLSIVGTTAWGGVVTP